MIDPKKIPPLAPLEKRRAYDSQYQTQKWIPQIGFGLIEWSVEDPRKCLPCSQSDMTLYAQLTTAFLSLWLIRSRDKVNGRAS